MTNPPAPSPNRLHPGTDARHSCGRGPCGRARRSIGHLSSERAPAPGTCSPRARDARHPPLRAQLHRNPTRDSAHAWRPGREAMPNIALTLSGDDGPADSRSAAIARRRRFRLRVLSPGRLATSTVTQTSFKPTRSRAFAAAFLPSRLHPDRRTRCSPRAPTGSPPANASRRPQSISAHSRACG